MNANELNEIKNILEKYNSDVSSNPDKYRLKDGGIQIYLPLALKKFNNKCSGGCGFLKNGKPIPGGLRIEKGQIQKVFGDQDFALKWMFHDMENLIEVLIDGYQTLLGSKRAQTNR
jgi:hypothetical protein